MLLFPAEHRLVRLRRQHEDLAVAHPPGSRRFNHLADDFLRPHVVDPRGDFNLRQKRLGVLALGVLVEVALLPADTLDFANVYGLERRTAESFEDPLGEFPEFASPIFVRGRLLQTSVDGIVSWG